MFTVANCTVLTVKPESNTEFFHCLEVMHVNSSSNTTQPRSYLNISLLTLLSDFDTE